MTTIFIILPTWIVVAFFFGSRIGSRIQSSDD